MKTPEEIIARLEDKVQRHRSRAWQLRADPRSSIAASTQEQQAKDAESLIEWIKEG